MSKPTQQEAREQVARIEKLAQDLRILHFHQIGAGALAEKLIDLGYSRPVELTLISDEEIKAWLKQEQENDEESYEKYASQLGIHIQDAINIARFGASRQLSRDKETQEVA